MLIISCSIICGKASCLSKFLPSLPMPIPKIYANYPNLSGYDTEPRGSTIGDHLQGPNALIFGRHALSSDLCKLRIFALAVQKIAFFLSSRKTVVSVSCELRHTLKSTTPHPLHAVREPTKNHRTHVRNCGLPPQVRLGDSIHAFQSTTPPFLSAVCAPGLTCVPTENHTLLIRRISTTQEMM